MSRSKQSNAWLKEHFEDPYVLKAQKEGYRSRAVYKLIELQEKDRLVSPGMNIVDLGAAPGGWAQLLTKWTGAKGKVFALDILDMESLPSVTFLKGDFTELSVQQAFGELIKNIQIDLVVSDMAPNMSGLNVVDQPKSMYLAEIALEFASLFLKPGGVFVVKVFQGSGFDKFLQTLKQRFDKVLARKPKASRARSREIYIVAKGLRKNG